MDIESKEKKEVKTRPAVSFESMELVIIDLLESRADTHIRVQHAKMGRVYDLVLNSAKQLCYAEPEISGKSIKLLAGRFGEFVMTDETVDVVLAHRDFMEAKRRELVDSYVHTAGNQYARIMEAVSGESANEKLSDASLVEVLGKLNEFAPGFRVYRDGGKLYFVCMCRSDEDGEKLRKMFGGGGFEVWGDGYNVHIKKAYDEKEVWDAKWRHGLVVKN